MISIWDSFVLNPMINTLVWFYGILGHNYALAILVATVITRLIVFPLTWKQQKSAAAMQEVQPKLNKLKEKYKNDPETMQRKQMELFKENGVNPLGGCLPLFIQMPILLGFYQAIRNSLATSPMQLLNLSQHLYQDLPAWLSWLPNSAELIPIDSYILAGTIFELNLAAPPSQPIHYILPVLVAFSTFLQNRLLTPPQQGGGGNDQAANMTKSMQLFMPLMIGYWAFILPSGLSIYWMTSNLIGVAQYAAMGRASLKNLFGTEDGSFSFRGLLGLPVPEPSPAGRRRSRK